MKKKYISIDPGKSKCGIIFADSQYKIVSEAMVITSDLLGKTINNLTQNNNHTEIIIGNGTSSKIHLKELNSLGYELIIAEEKNTTYRAKNRYFEIFPLKGFKKFLPREIFILNQNLDAIAALIILEDYLQMEFHFSSKLKSKNWQK